MPLSSQRRGANIAADTDEAGARMAGASPPTPVSAAKDAPPVTGGRPLRGDGQLWKRLVIVMILSPVKNSSLMMKANPRK